MTNQFVKIIFCSKIYTSCRINRLMYISCLVSQYNLRLCQCRFLELRGMSYPFSGSISAGVWNAARRGMPHALHLVILRFLIAVAWTILNAVFGWVSLKCSLIVMLKMMTIFSSDYLLMLSLMMLLLPISLRSTFIASGGVWGI